jgi:CHAD domain-containing protein
MRVAFRRMRAALRVFREPLAAACAPELLAQLQDHVREVARALGAVRDLDVSLEALAAYAGSADQVDRPALDRLRDTWREQRAAARTQLLLALDGPPMAALHAELDSTIRPLAGAVPSKRNRRRQTLGKAATRLVARALRRFRRRGSRLIAPSEEDLHRLRIEAKRLRYTVEFMAPAFGGAEESLVTLVTEIQDDLGAVHDADVAVGTLLGEVERAAINPERAADAGPYARLIRSYLERRADALHRFQQRWPDVPRPKRLRRKLGG